MPVKPIEEKFPKFNCHESIGDTKQNLTIKALQGLINEEMLRVLRPGGGTLLKFRKF
jgi:hypothetical protein